MIERVLNWKPRKPGSSSSIGNTYMYICSLHCIDWYCLYVLSACNYMYQDNNISCIWNIIIIMQFKGFKLFRRIRLKSRFFSKNNEIHDLINHSHCLLIYLTTSCDIVIFRQPSKRTLKDGIDIMVNFPRFLPSLASVLIDVTYSTHIYCSTSITVCKRQTFNH